MKTVLFWVLVGVCCVAAEVIVNSVCDGRDAPTISTSNEISVDPCPGGSTGEPCVLYRGSNSTIQIKFTPTITTSQRLKSTIAWVKGRNNELSFRGMRPDACLYMECPVKANEMNTFTATLNLGSTLPTGTYPLKVKIQEQHRRHKKVFACQLFTIRLTDPEE